MAGGGSEEVKLVPPIMDLHLREGAASTAMIEQDKEIPWPEEK